MFHVTMVRKIALRRQSSLTGVSRIGYPRFRWAAVSPEPDGTPRYGAESWSRRRLRRRSVSAGRSTVLTSAVSGGRSD